MTRISFDQYVEQAEVAIVVARKEIAAMIPRAEFDGNLAAYGRHIQPIDDALNKALEAVRVRWGAGFNLEQWQAVGNRYNRLVDKFNRKAARQTRYDIPGE